MNTSFYRSRFNYCANQVAKSKNMNYSQNSFCAYQTDGEIFWSAKFICGYSLVDEKFVVTVDSSIKPIDFDVTQFLIIEPCRPRRITDERRATAAFAAKGLQISSTKYMIPCENTDSFSAALEDNVREIFNDLLKKRASFFTDILSNYAGLPHYLKTQWKFHPYEAGLAFLCEDDFDAAIRCFELAEKNGCYVRQSIGNLGRYLHLVFIDYCSAKKERIEWTDSLLREGFVSNMV